MVDNPLNILASFKKHKAELNKEKQPIQLPDYMSEKSARFNIESHSFIDLKRKQAQIALFKEAIKLKISKFTSKHKELMSSLSRSVTYTKPNQDPSQKKKDLLDCLTCKKSERLNFSYKADNKSKTSMESRSPREVVTTIRGSSN